MYLLLHSLKICQLFLQFCWMHKPKHRGDKVICFNQCSWTWLNICMREPFTTVCGEQVIEYVLKSCLRSGGFSVYILHVSHQHHSTVNCFCVLKCLMFITAAWFFCGCYIVYSSHLRLTWLKFLCIQAFFLTWIFTNIPSFSALQTV